MPYVLQERRPALNKVVDELVKADIKYGDIRLFLVSIVYAGAPIELNYNNRRIEEAVRKSWEVGVKPNGDINYILFKYCKYNINPSYNNYKAFMGEVYDAMGYTVGEFKNEFRESAEWIRIKLLTPYEEEAIKRNGDV